MAARPQSHFEELDAAQLRGLADRCRSQARTVSTHSVRASLLDMARDYDRRAAALDAPR